VNPFTAIAAAPDEGESMYTFGPHMTVKLSSAATNGLYFLAVEETPPGRGPALHVHHQQDELFYVLEGRYRFQVGSQTIEAPAGTTAAVPRGTPHAFVNVSDKPGRLLFVLSPGLDAEGFFRALSRLPQDSPPDPAELERIGVKYGTEFVGPPLSV